MARKNLTRAIAYLRTSSATNVGVDRDSEVRQRASIRSFAKHGGFELVGEYYDAAVSGADPQVHPLPAFDYLRTRLTHTIEVAHVGRIIATEVAKRLALTPGAPDFSALGDIVYSACRAHDLGTRAQAWPPTSADRDSEGSLKLRRLDFDA